MKLPVESARLAAWTTACLTGLVAPDDLADYAVGPGQLHRVAGLGLPEGDGTDADAASLPLAVAELRRRGAERAWLAWPVPGDPAGLSGPGEANRMAFEAGQAVVVEPAGSTGALALVPSRLGSSGVLWTALPALDARSVVTSLSEADRDLKESIRVSADDLDRLDVARLLPRDEAHVEAALARMSPVQLPPGFDPRAHSVLDTTQRLAALIELAQRDDGGAVSRGEADRRNAVLRDLARSVRRGFTAAVNALAEDSARAR